MRYIIWQNEDGWQWQLTDSVNGFVQPQTEIVGPYETEIQAIASLLAYSAKVDL